MIQKVDIVFFERKMDVLIIILIIVIIFLLFKIYMTHDGQFSGGKYFHGIKWFYDKQFTMKAEVFGDNVVVTIYAESPKNIDTTDSRIQEVIEFTHMKEKVNHFYDILDDIRKENTSSDAFEERGRIYTIKYVQQTLDSKGKLSISDSNKRVASFDVRAARL